MTDIYRRNLPHWLPDGQMFFITFRLANSLPVEVVQELQNQREMEKQDIRAKFSGIQQQNELYKLDKKIFWSFR